MKMWIARNKSGNLFLYRNRPYFYRLYGVWESDDYLQLNKADYPEVSFENSPQEVEIVIKK